MITLSRDLALGVRPRGGGGIIPPVGFALNGSTNTALKAMLAAVSGGSARGKIVFKGDSTTVGFGGANVSGVVSDTISTTNARQYRPTAVLATELSAIGYNTLDNAQVAAGNVAAASLTLPQYDPRFAFTGAAWTATLDQRFAGGGYLSVGSAAMTFTPTETVDTFDLIMLGGGGAVNVLVNGAAPASITCPGASSIVGNVVTFPVNGALIRMTVGAGSVGNHVLSLSLNSGSPIMSKFSAFNSTVRAIDIVNHASGSARSADQATNNPSGFPWGNQNALAFEAPALTIINLGLNDAGNSVPAATYEANLQAIITTAKASGDVLLVYPHPANPSTFPLVNQTTLRDAAAALAVTNSVAFMNLYTYFGDWAAVASRMSDGIVHGNRGFYAEVGQVYRRCIQVMAQ